MRYKLLVGVLFSVVSASAFSANRPSGYTTICKSDETCSVSTSTNVAFGASDKFVYKVLKGSFTCNVATFGSDPNPAKSVKECSIPSDGSSSSSSTSSSSTSTSSSSSSSSSSSGGNCGSGGGATVCLKAQGGSNDIDLSWTVSGTITSAQIYRDTDADPSGRTRIASLSSSDRTYSDTTAASGKTYYYWVKFGANGSSYNSGVASASYSGSSSSSTSSTSSSSSSSSSGSTTSCKAGSTYTNTTVDCGGATVGLSCSGDSEGQPPVFILKNATIKNVKLSAKGGSDGIHCTGNCTMQNVDWLDICEDAATNKTDGITMTIIGGSAFNSASSGVGGKPDKVFQHNSKNSTTVIKGGFTLTGEHGKLWRSCGNCTNNGGPRYVKIDGVNVNAKIGSIVGVNSNYKDKATIRNLKIKDYKSGSPSVCEEFTGVQKGQGESKKIGEKWNTSSCDVSKSDVSAL